jgi:hypothetical protein
MGVGKVCGDLPGVPCPSSLPSSSSLPSLLSSPSLLSPLSCRCPCRPHCSHPARHCGGGGAGCCCCWVMVVAVDVVVDGCCLGHFLQRHCPYPAAAYFKTNLMPILGINMSKFIPLVIYPSNRLRGVIYKIYFPPDLTTHHPK